MKNILERPDNWITDIYEFGDSIIYTIADLLGISYYDLCTYVFVYLYLLVVSVLTCIIIIQLGYLRKLRNGQ